MQTDTSAVSRRRLLSTAAAVGSLSLSGCSALWDQSGASDVVAYNAASRAQTVSITISDVDAAEPHTSRTLSLAPGEKVDPVNRSKLPMNAQYTVTVRVSGGPSEMFEWDDTDVELAPLYVFVDDSENVKFLLQAG